MPSAYIAGLYREVALPADAPKVDSLRQRVEEWYGDLPEVSRFRAFAMSEIEAALGTQGRYLSPVLLGLGWQRKRRWTGSGQYPRYWVPPCDRSRQVVAQSR